MTSFAFDKRRCVLQGKLGPEGGNLILYALSSQELLAELERMANRASGVASQQSAEGQNGSGDETLLAINLLVQYFFRELSSQGRVRRWVLQRINIEMQEVLTRGAVSKIIKGLKVRFPSLGVSR